MEQQQVKENIYIGIDTGDNTGIAIWSKSRKGFIKIETVKIHKALLMVLNHHLSPKFNLMRVRIEDARKRSMNPNDPDYYKKQQGVGSVKRDANVWEDFCTDYAIPFEMVAPQSNMTKVKTEKFRQLTGLYVTSSHSIDAAMLVLGM